MALAFQCCPSCENKFSCSGIISRGHGYNLPEFATLLTIKRLGFKDECTHFTIDPLISFLLFFFFFRDESSTVAQLCMLTWAGIPFSGFTIVK